MLKVLGSKRVLFIGLVSAAIALFGYAYYYYLLPEHEKSTKELRSTKSSVDQKYTEVIRLKEEYVLLQSQLREYKELEARGFFNIQDRVEPLDKIAKLSNYAGLLNAKVKFSKGLLINDPVAEKAGQVVLKTATLIDIKSIDDVDVYSFVKFIEEKFPGRIDITSFKLNRIEIFNTAILRQIGGGAPTPLVDANITFDWLTMAPKDIIAPSEDSSAGGK